MTAQLPGSRQEKILLVFMGLTAGGKSTLAQAFAAQTGGTHINTDTERKKLAGLQPTQKRPDGVEQGIYSPELTARTYKLLLDKAEKAFSGGAELVLLDGSYSRRVLRDEVRSRADQMGARLLFIYCFCSEEETRKRLDHRARDAEAVSDGRWEIYLYQQKKFEFPEQEKDCLSFDTSGDPLALAVQLSAKLRECLLSGTV